MALFNKRLVFDMFPVRPSIKGIGTADWGVYAKRLKNKLDYINTYYHERPRLDIKAPDFSVYADLDFIIASDVLEYVEPPVEGAFVNLKKMLKPGGVLILTVPHGIKFEETIEHFPNLHDYHVEKQGETWILINRTREGIIEETTDLRFHGSFGDNLEMRVFPLNSIKRAVESVGFTDIRVHDENIMEYGIYW